MLPVTIMGRPTHFEVSTIMSGLGLDNEQADAKKGRRNLSCEPKILRQNADRVEIIFPVQLVDHYIGGSPLCCQCL